MQRNILVGAARVRATGTTQRARVLHQSARCASSALAKGPVAPPRQAWPRARCGHARAARLLALMPSTWARYNAVVLLQAVLCFIGNIERNGAGCRRMFPPSRGPPGPSPGRGRPADGHGRGHPAWRTKGLPRAHGRGRRPVQPADGGAMEVRWRRGRPPQLSNPSRVQILCTPNLIRA